MSDVFDAAKRSEVMSRIRGRGNKTTEIALVAALRKAGITGWRRHILVKVKANPKRGSQASKLEVLMVKPDFIFRQAKLAVFVDGCFWHQCPIHSKVPENNHEFWEQKLWRNVERDRQANRALRAAGWRVLRLWEHEVQDPARSARKVKRQLNQCLSKRDQHA